MCFVYWYLGVEFDVPSTLGSVDLFCPENLSFRQVCDSYITSHKEQTSIYFLFYKQAMKQARKQARKINSRKMFRVQNQQVNSNVHVLLSFVTKSLNICLF